MSRQHGQVDIVVNNAGVALGQISIEEVTYDEMEWLLGINLWGVVYGTKTFARTVAQPGLLEKRLQPVRGRRGVAFWVLAKALIFDKNLKSW